MRNLNAITSILFSLILLTNLSAQVQFVKHTIDNDTHGVGGIYACDIDGDTDIDILAASLEDNQLIWFRNDGSYPINWSKIIIGSGVGNAHSPFAEDIDGDGDLDIACAAYQGSPGIVWWRNDGGDPVTWSKFTVSSIFDNAHEIYCSDLDQDGDIDILGASTLLNEIAWFRNNGGDPISWTKQSISNDVNQAKSVTSGDLDGDGDLDVIGVSLSRSDVFWWRNDGGEPIQWTQFTIDGWFTGAHRVQAVDMDFDGDIDIVGAAYTGHLIAWWRNDGGDPVDWQRLSIASDFTNACMAHAIDLDNDSDLDVIGTAQGLNQIAWWRNDGGEPIVWSKNIIDENFTRPWPLFNCDVDGDGDIDIISGSSHDGSNIIAWWETLNVTDVGEQTEELPAAFELKQNFPNPFNPVTQITFSLTKSEHIQLKIFDINGEEIITLVNDHQTAGTKTFHWNGKNKFGEKVTSGVYLYTLTSSEQIISKKMVLLK